jgi:hypothetical protein
LADFVAKGFCSSEHARLIQDQAPTSNVDSKIHSSRFDCCVFLFYSFRAATFATKSAPSGGLGISAFAPLMGGKRKARHICETALLTDSVEKVASTRTAKIHLSQIGNYIQGRRLS